MAVISTTDSIHDFYVHRIQSVQFTDTQVIKLYPVSLYNSAVVTLRWTDETKVEKIIIYIVNNDLNQTGIDITRIAVGGISLDIAIDTGISEGYITLILTNNIAIDNNIVKYYVTPGDL